MTQRPQASVWLPLLAVILGVVVLVDVTVIAGMWVLAGLAFVGAITRASGAGGTMLRVRSRVVDTSIFVGLGAVLVVLATSGVLD